MEGNLGRHWWGRGRLSHRLRSIFGRCRRVCVKEIAGNDIHAWVSYKLLVCVLRNGGKCVRGA